MQTIQHTESYEGSTATSASGAEGVHEDSREVVLTIQGYSGPQAYADSVSTEIISHKHISADSYVNWRRIAIPELFLEQTAHLLFIQGISPTQFFLASSLRIGLGKKAKEYGGPMLFLNGSISPPFEAPAKFSKLVLGQLMKTSSDKTNVSDTFMALLKYESQRHSRKGT